MRPCGIFKWSNTSTSESSLAPRGYRVNFAYSPRTIQNQTGGGSPLTGLIEVADVSGLGSRRSGSCDSRAHALRCAREWPLCMPSPSMQSTFSLSPLSPLFFSFFIILPPEREKSRAGFLDGAGGAFGEAFGGFPYSRVRLLVPPSRLFHDHSSGFWCSCPRPSWPERLEPRTGIRANARQKVSLRSNASMRPKRRLQSTPSRSSCQI